MLIILDWSSCGCQAQGHRKWDISSNLQRHLYRLCEYHRKRGRHVGSQLPHTFTPRSHVPYSIEAHISLFTSSCSSTKFIIVSSVYDIHHDCIYPTPPFPVPAQFENYKVRTHAQAFNRNGKVCRKVVMKTALLTPACHKLEPFGNSRIS